jgi:hypothetical protein
MQFWRFLLRVLVPGLVEGQNCFGLIKNGDEIDKAPK